jgi:PAS domain S-box-containing protein
MLLSKILGYPLLFVAVLELFLGALLLKHNPRGSSVNRSVAVFSFFSAAFSLSTAIMYIRASMGLDYNLLARFSWIGWLTIPPALQTVYNLEGEGNVKARRAGLVLYPFWGAVLLLTLTTDLVVTERYRLFPFLNEHGPLEDYFRFAGGLLILWLIYMILRLRKQVSGLRRAQLSHFFYGTIIFGTGGSIVAGFMPILGHGGVEPGLAAYFSLPWVLLIFYAITRYRLFDIRLVISRFLNILLLSLVISSLHFILFKALEPALGVVASIFISIPVIGFVFFGTPLSRSVQGWVNDLVLGSRFEYQRMLTESAQASISILHLDELLHFLINSVREGLSVDRACLFLPGEGGRYTTRQCYRTIEAPGEDLLLPRAVVERLAAWPQPLLRDELAASQDPSDHGIAYALGEFDAELLLPLVSKGQLRGVLSLGERRNGEAYLQSDIEVLQTLTGHAAIAIENARLFEEAGRMRASLREQEGLFRTLANTLPAALFIHRGGKLLYANPAGVRMTGYSMEEILNMEFWGVVHPDYRQLIVSRGRARLEGDEPPPQYEFKIRRKDGTDRWVLMTAGTIEYEGKSAIIGSIFDITDRKHAEEEKDRLFEENARQYRARLKEQERYSAILGASADGFWINNGSDMRFEFVNDAYCRMTGYTREELMGLSIADLETVEKASEIDEHTRCIREQRYDVFETRHRRKDGSLIDLEVSVNYYDRDGIFFSFLRDITERKRAEAEKAQLQAEKERILKDLHDGIGGLTTNINLLAELARASENVTEIKRSLGTIAELSRESLSEIRGFLQSLDPRDLGWPAIGAEFRHLGNTLIEPHQIRFTITLSLPEEGGMTSSLVALNLFRIYKEALVNIVKHAKATEVFVSLGVEQGRLTLEVRDNGVGLSPTRGRGRGLLNMRSRAEEIGGTLVAAPAEGYGTVIRLSVVLP